MTTEFHYEQCDPRPNSEILCLSAWVLFSVPSFNLGTLLWVLSRFSRLESFSFPNLLFLHRVSCSLLVWGIEFMTFSARKYPFTGKRLASGNVEQGMQKKLKSHSLQPRYFFLLVLFVFLINKLYVFRAVLGLPKMKLSRKYRELPAPDTHIQCPPLLGFVAPVDHLL